MMDIAEDNVFQSKIYHAMLYFLDSSDDYHIIVLEILMVFGSGIEWCTYFSDIDVI